MLAEDPSPNARTVFPNPKATHPYEGDFIYQVRDGNHFIRSRFILDRKAMRLTFVAIRALPLMM